MDVRKTNGSIEEYDKAKLARGIHEAYKTASQYCDDSIVVSIINNLYIYDGIYSSEIRRQVVDSLMSINKKVALAYIEKFDADLDLRKKRLALRAPELLPEREHMSLPVLLQHLLRFRIIHLFSFS